MDTKIRRIDLEVDSIDKKVNSLLLRVLKVSRKIGLPFCMSSLIGLPGFIESDCRNNDRSNDKTQNPCLKYLPPSRPGPPRPEP